MRSSALFSLVLALSFPLVSHAAVSISSSYGGQLQKNGEDIPSYDPTNPATNPYASIPTPDMPKAPQFIQDADGFYTQVDGSTKTPEEQEKELLDAKQREREANTVQVYRGEEANKPKLEPKRTHLMYEKTQY